jgi:hypothetical protein
MIVRLLLLLIISFSFCSIDAQKTIESSDLNSFFTNSSNKIYAENKGFIFMNIPNDKDISNRLAGEIVISDTSNIDFSKLNVDFLLDDYQYYLVKNYDVLFVLKSVNHLIKEINNEK